MISFIEDKVSSINLSKTNKVLADFFVKNEKKIAFMSSKEIAISLNISDTSVIRFVKLLGFKNFGEFKIFCQTTLSQSLLSPPQKLSINKDVISSSRGNDKFIENIETQIEYLFSDHSLKKLGRIKDLISKSRKKFVVGLKSTSGIASFFGLRLGFLFKGVYTFTSSSSELIKHIGDIEEGDCLILFAFPKYSKLISLLVEICKEKKADIIIFTDSETSPVAYKGTLTFFLPTSNLSFFNSIIPAQIITEFILTSLSKDLSDSGIKRLEFINENLNSIL